LTKIPIAVALLHKVSTEKISLNTPISVEPGNFTEDGHGQIQVKRRYTLKALLMQMIAYSSNIASNQLIDYLGWDYIDQVLKKRGYRVVRVSSKFMGERVMPANPGRASNRFTSNELTRMMVEIYNRKHPGDEVLIEALKKQYDRLLGFAAAKGSPAQWIGEKTGQSSKVEGTTAAFKISGQTYIITVIDNRGDSDLTIRRCVAKLVNYIAKNGYL
jgi:beta-lactamase class A